MEYFVSMEIGGRQVPVGSIAGERAEAACFRYAADYLERTDAAAISVRLPLQTEPFTPRQTRTFFESLLPEGFTRRSIATFLRIDEGDYLGILYALGQECMGALRIYREGDAPQAAYVPLTPEQVRLLAAEGAPESTTLVTEAHLSLGGASGKVGLYYDAASGAWYLPRGTAPSTHILKQSHVRYEKIVPNEQLCLRTAALCGLRVAESRAINTGTGQDRELLLAVRRYDRIFPPSPERISGLPVPQLLHQEDFGQALGIPASEKYEHGQHYLRAMFTLLRERSARPIEDQTELWDRIVFDWLIGNTDAHIKNFSLLYAPDLRSVRLAPAYDMIHTGYKGLSRNMALAIGGVYPIAEITRESFRLAAREVGLGEKMALSRFDRMVSRFRPALEKAAAELQREGLDGAAEWKNRILQSAGRALAHR
ncbi:MAG: HipA domain-containing protein [Clostridia bacterium]|nr:HipA domain-containing protein [Clostridia bacterium]